MPLHSKTTGAVECDLNLPRPSPSLFFFCGGGYQSPKVVVPSSVPSSAAGASAATLVQPRLQHSAADSAPRQHQHVASASAATLMQLRLQHSAADSAPGQHQCVSDQARHFDDVTADAKATSIKIEEFQELYRHTRQNRDVA
nr:hypothetical protein CFP56_35965 [Quercus suber]